jgi:lipoate-protein ligase A
MFKASEYSEEDNLYAAPMNMAVDEVLLGQCRLPMLRVYRWARPSVSFGYFQRFDELAPEITEGRLDLVRRWTGGGVVSHGTDWTYSIIVPRHFMGVLGSPPEAYAKIHETLSVLLRDECAIDAEAVSVDGGDGGTDCFQNPVKSDVVVAGRKVAGAGQRRTRAGLLHQGSVQGVMLSADFGVRLAERLSGEVTVVGELSTAVMEAAKTLALEKYASEAWLRKY